MDTQLKMIFRLVIINFKMYLRILKTKQMIKCPKCGSTNCHSTDNDPISHDEKWFKELNIQHDYEITIMFECDNCDVTWSNTFDIVKNFSPYAKAFTR